MKKNSGMKQKLTIILDKLPYIRGLRNEVNIYKTLVPPGHYHSPIPPKEEILKRKEQIFGIREKEIAGIDLNEKEQLELLEEIKKYYNVIPFKEDKDNTSRYYYNNTWYGHSDAIFLYSIIRHFQPNEIIEIGCGFSSAIILDTGELFFKNKIQYNFIDPNPQRLLSFLKENDKKNPRIKIVDSCVQDVDLDLFKQLEENDILFVDSSHVSKTGSDVNYILFDILPNLDSGVLIHFHDILYPFEYPKEWVLEGRAWNESYILRAFLQYNSKFKIVLFNTFLEHYYENWFSENMPLCLKEKGGSIWLRKL